jgi:hypothetical protein
MRALLALLALAACSSPSPYAQTDGGAPLPAEKGKTYRYTFDSTAEFEGILGNWTADKDDSAPSAPLVFRQHAELGNPDFPRIVLRQLTFDATRLKVRCKMEDGDTDQACGVMFRFQDSDNYYVTRANALEDNVRIYRVVGGERQQFAGHNMPITPGAWHTLEVVAEGTKIRVLWDDAEIFSADDATFASGKVGLWTKADSITAFDDLEVTQL